MPTAAYADSMEHVIVGIDTGKTSAIACIGLKAEVKKLETARSAGISWFIDRIMEAGIPVVIAGDKRRPQDTVRKLASMFNCVLFAPNEDIPVKKKNEEAAAYGSKSVHERDALSAAMAAYNRYSNKLKQTEKLARLANADPDAVKAMVIKHYSVYEALKNKKNVGRFVRK